MIRNKDVDQTYDKMSNVFETEANMRHLNFEESRMVLRRMLNDIDVLALESFWYFKEHEVQSITQNKPITDDSPYY